MNQVVENIWQIIRSEAKKIAVAEPVMATYYQLQVLDHNSLGEALAHTLAGQLASSQLPRDVLYPLFVEVINAAPVILAQAEDDLKAHVERDPACNHFIVPLLYFKGFQALQTHRIAHWLWLQGRQAMAMYLQNRASEIFAVDIHPAARIGGGIMIDHATGVVIGETTVIEDNVSMLHGVSLGGTGKACGDRHPKIRAGVLIAAGAKILGNIEVGEGAKIGAGSLVLDAVPPHTTVAGVPARIVGQPSEAEPARGMDQHIDDDTGVSMQKDFNQ
ncbi:MAG: serine O-acetyltransferase [Porticoccaceae bacterium]